MVGVRVIVGESVMVGTIEGVNVGATVGEGGKYSNAIGVPKMGSAIAAATRIAAKRINRQP